MTLSKKTKEELIIEVKKLQRQVDRLQKKQNTSSPPTVSSIKDSRWESFFKNAANTIIIVDKKGIIVDINKIAKGSSKEKIVGQSAYNFVEKESAKKMKQAIDLVFKTKKPQTYDSWRVDEKQKAYYYKSKATAVVENKKVVAVVIDATEITNEIIIQNQLKQNEERFKKLSDSAFEGIVIHQYGKVAEVNKAICKMFGYSEKEIIGQSIFKFIDANYHPLAKEKLKHKNENAYEMIMLRKGNKPFWAELMAGELIYKDSPARVVAIRDITERKKAEQVLKESEENLNRVLENINELVYFVEFMPDNKRSIKYLGKNIEELLGVTASEYKNEQEKLIKLCHPDDLESIKSVAQKLHKTKKPQLFVYRFLHRKKGEYIWLEERITPQLDSKGNYVGNFGLTRDVTERIVAEKQLRESEQKFRMLAENASDLIYRCQVYPEVKYEYVSPSAKALTGYSPEDFYTQPLLSFKLIHPEDVHLLGDSENLIKSKVKLSNVKGPSLILRWIKKDGTVIWTETRNKPIFDENKRLIGVEGISRDITQQKLSEEQLKDSEERFKILSNATFEGIVFSENGKIIDANDQFVEMYGFNSSKEIIGKHIIDDFVVSEQKELARRFVRLPKSEPYEVKTIRKDGTIISVEIKGQNIPYFGKNIRATIIYNITERKQYEFNLRESERTLSTLMNNLPGMAYRCDYDTQWTMRFVSKGFQELTGYNPKEIVNNKKRAYADIIHPEDRSIGKIKIEDAIEKQQPFEVEYRIIQANGAVKWVLEKGEGVFSDDGKLLFIEGFITDINDKKQFELEITQSRENYKSLVDYSPVAVFIHIDGKVVFANPSALKMAEIKDMAGALSHSLFDFLLPEYHKDVEERIKNAAAGISQDFIEVKIKSLTGEIKEIETKPILIKFDGKNAVLTVAHDISTQKQLLKEQARAQIAEETNELLEQEITQKKITQLQLQESQKYTRLLINSSLDMICASDKNGNVTEFNRAAQKTFGYKAEEVIGQPVSVLYSNPEERIRITNVELYGKGTFSGEVVNIKKNGEKFIAFLSASVLKNERGEVVGAMGVSRDISELKKAEKELRESEERYKAIYNQAYIGIASIGFDGRIFQANQRFCEILGYKQEELMQKTHADIIHPDDLISFPQKEMFISNKVDNMQAVERYIHKNGSVVFANLTITLVKDANKQPLQYVIVYEDITERKKSEKKLREQSAKFNAIIESSSHIIWTVDRNICLTTFNQNYDKQLRKNYGIEARIGLSMITGDSVSSTVYNSFWIKKYESAFAGNPQYFETFFVNKDGNDSWREIYLNPIFGADGTVLEVSGIGHDITEKKKSEEQIKLSLQEKEVLLKEVHHRVKNNLQVISSILNLQSSYVKDEGTLNILKESQNRIKSMAFIHESLYQTKDFSSINFTEYVINLSQNLIHSYSNFDHEIKLNLDIQNVFLNLDLAIPCGLIINEIVSNALKYAFVDNSEGGEITINMKVNGEDLILLIGDNGKGLPKHIDYRNTESLGLQLVVTLTDQLSGTIELDLTKGTYYTIVFKQNQVKNRI